MTTMRSYQSPRDYAESIYTPGCADRVFGHADGAAVQWKRTAREWRGPCPWHRGNNPTAMRLKPDTGRWKCWNCDAAGGPLEWLANGRKGLRGADLVGAVDKLAGMAGARPWSEVFANGNQPATTPGEDAAAVKEASRLREQAARLRLQKQKREESDNADKRRTAQTIWGCSEAVPGTPAALYLARRRISARLHPALSCSVRWIEADRLRDRDVSGRYAGAVKGGIASSNMDGCVVYGYRTPGGLSAVEVEGITSAGEKTKQRWRRTLGPRGAGVVFRLTEGLPEEGHLLAVAEGPVTALAVYAIVSGAAKLQPGTPHKGDSWGWSQISEIRATGSAGGFTSAAAERWPDNAVDHSAVLIVRDVDMAGAKARLKLRKEIREQGRVSLIWPTENYDPSSGTSGDIADWIVETTEENVDE